MILICKNYNENNESYEEVVDWLLYREASFDFISGEDYYEDGKGWSLELNNKEEKFSIPFSQYKSVWFRGFLRHRHHLSKTFDNLESTNDNIAELRWRLGQEISKINAQIFNKFKAAYMLPDPEAIKIDKFSTLQKAKEIGLEIPISLITNSRNELSIFVEKHSEVITKPLYETLLY